MLLRSALIYEQHPWINLIVNLVPRFLSNNQAVLHTQNLQLDFQTNSQKNADIIPKSTITINPPKLTKALITNSDFHTTSKHLKFFTLQKGCLMMHNNFQH